MAFSDEDIAAMTNGAIVIETIPTEVIDLTGGSSQPMASPSPTAIKKTTRTRQPAQIATGPVEELNDVSVVDQGFQPDQRYKSEEFLYTIISVDTVLEGSYPAIMKNLKTGESRFGGLPISEVKEGKINLVPPSPRLKEVDRWVTPDGDMGINGPGGSIKVKITSDAPIDETDIIGYIVRNS